ncbi:MAG: hypothetical protein ABJB12_16290 [Pseudomonadota bacterium]
MHLAAISLACAPLSLLLVLGCSSSTASDDGKPAVPVVCTAPGYSTDAAAVTINEVDALLADPAGKAVANLPVQVCGTDLCFNGTSGKDGKTVVQPHSKLTQAAFKYGDGFDFAELAAPLSAESSQDLGTIIALPLPPVTEGAAFPKSGKVSNGDVTLSLAKGTQTVHDTLTYDSDTDLVFRSVPIPIADSSAALDPSFGFELGYALAPLGTTFCPAAQLNLANSLDWPSGTEVEVFIQGLNADQAWAPYGTWVKVAEGSVSADGSSIHTTSGGIPILSAIAVRRK